MCARVRSWSRVCSEDMIVPDIHTAPAEKPGNLQSTRVIESRSLRARLASRSRLVTLSVRADDAGRCESGAECPSFRSCRDGENQRRTRARRKLSRAVLGVSQLLLFYARATVAHHPRGATRSNHPPVGLPRAVASARAHRPSAATTNIRHQITHQSSYVAYITLASQAINRRSHRATQRRRSRKSCAPAHLPCSSRAHHRRRGQAAPNPVDCE